MSPAASRNPPDEISRGQQLERLRSETFDVAVIGAGINGAAIARDAAMRGLTVALVDRGDIAGATSSHSSKLIHGGLRYLAQGQLRLVREALNERERLHRLSAPHLVHSIRFLFPCYRARKPGRLTLWAGLVLYDLLARTPAAERHRRLSAREIRQHEPALRGDGLTGGALYYDGWADDARLTLENALDASIHGAALANYLAIEGFSRSASRISAASARDLIGGNAFELHARYFVNASGPWLDDLRRLDEPGARASVRLTKGVHLIVSASRLPVRDSLVLTDDASRIVFVMPRDGWVMVGTTDTDFDHAGANAEPATTADSAAPGYLRGDTGKRDHLRIDAGDRNNLRADATDIDYLLGIVNAAIPAVNLTAKDVAYSFAGLRALEIDGTDSSPSSVSREEIMLESASRLLSVAGGKLTTHRAIAQKVVDKLMRNLDRQPGPSPTLITPLPGARTTVASGAGASPDNLGDDSGPNFVTDEIDREIVHALTSRYGTGASSVIAILRDNPELAQPLAPGAPAIRAEVIHAIRAELATSVSDFLVRRTSMVWRDPASAIAAAPAVAHLMGAELGWDSRRIACEIEEFFRTQALRNADRVKTDRDDLHEETAGDGATR